MAEPIAIQKETREITRANISASETLQSGVIATIREKGIDVDKSNITDVGSNTGASIIAYSPAEENLDLEAQAVGVLYNAGGNTYQLGPAKVTREDVDYKLDDNTRNTIELSNTILNAYMIRAKPNEYSEGNAQAVLRDPKTGSTLTAHDFRWAGDTRNLMAIGRIKSKYLEELKKVLGKLVNFIPYLAPIQEAISMKTTYVDVKNEGREYTVDLLGNKIVPTSPEFVDDTALGASKFSPIRSAEIDLTGERRPDPQEPVNEFRVNPNFVFDGEKFIEN